MDTLHFEATQAAEVAAAALRESTTPKSEKDAKVAKVDPKDGDATGGKQKIKDDSPGRASKDSILDHEVHDPFYFCSNSFLKVFVATVMFQFVF